MQVVISQGKIALPVHFVCVRAQVFFFFVHASSYFSMKNSFAYALCICVFVQCTRFVLCMQDLFPKGKYTAHAFCICLLILCMTFFVHAICFIS